MSYGFLAFEREEFCKEATNMPPQLDHLSSYPAEVHEDQAGNVNRNRVQGFRGENQLKDVVQRCPLVAATDEVSEECAAQMNDYVTSMGLFALPAAMGVLSSFVWLTCCGVVMCRCCRRCCLCQERKGPRGAYTWQKLVIITVASVCTIAIFVSSLVAYYTSNLVNEGINDMLCHMLTMADETLNGSPYGPQFLGIDEGIQRINMIRTLLDVDGQAMTDVRAILDETANFASAMDNLLMRIDHMQRVLTLVGQHKIQEHSCWICQQAAGSNVTGQQGLLTALTNDIQASSASAMRSIQRSAQDMLTGSTLVDVSTAVQRGGVALEVFKQGYAGSLVNGFGSFKRVMDTVEDARHTVFQSMAAFCIIMSVVVGNVGVWFAKRSKAKYPSATPSCITWCCGFCAVTFALIFAGFLLLVAVPLSEMCNFWRYDLMTYSGVDDYYRVIGLFDASDLATPPDPLAVDVWRTCLTPNGSGDILDALRLKQRLYFQQILKDGFEDLENKMASAVLNRERFEVFVTQARDFGGLFILDPDDPLPLEPNAQPKMIGSSLDPDDREAPDGETIVHGLNTFASLIAGQNQYYFEHGTAGGSRMITATQPTEAEVADEPIVRQNALTYARMKESILSATDILRCDTLDSRFHVEERTCSFEEFKVWVLEYAVQLREAGDKLGQEALLSRTRISSDLKNSLTGVLEQVKALRTIFTCRFLWKRWEDFDFTLCNVALPAMLEGTAAWTVVAAFSALLLSLHYKMWRHFLDNKVVGEELERFSKRYGYLDVAKT